MRARPSSALLLSLALITSACSSPMNKQPDIKQNPHPKMRYSITLTIKDAPGRFDSVTGFAQYRVSNDRCVPLQPMSGARLAPDENVSLDLKRVSDDVYTGNFYLDQLQDEDYFGMGVCHWELVAVSAALKVEHVSFGPDLLKDDVLAQKSVTRFFTDRDYFDARDGIKGMFPLIPGETSAAAYKPEIQTHLFSVTLLAKEDFR